MRYALAPSLFWFLRTLCQAGPSSQGVCFSIWRRIASGGIVLYLCRTATPSASMRAKQWVHFLLDETAVRFGDSGTWVLKQMGPVCYLSNRHTNGASTRRWPSTARGTRPWPQWRSTWSWLMPACQVGTRNRTGGESKSKYDITWLKEIIECLHLFYLSTHFFGWALIQYDRY